MNTDCKPLSRPRRILGWAFLLLAGALAGLTACTPGQSSAGKNNPMPYTIISGPAGPAGSNTLGNAGIDLRLSQAQTQEPTPTPLPVTSGEPLSAQEIEAIFARLPDLPVSPDDQTAFQYPVELLPPPRPGTVIKDSFPPAETTPIPEVEAAGALEVLRYAPEGEIFIAPFISVTFNQPMVPLGTLGDLAAASVPVKIEPTLPGTWRWLGTKTLTFEYDSELVDRLPKATEYTVSIPAGTKSLSGGVLAQAVAWNFATPAPTAVTMYPGNAPQPLEPLIFVAFDQRIDPTAVLNTIQVLASNQRVEVALASQAEVEADKEVSRLVKDAQAGRWLAFKPTRPLPAGTAILVSIGPGTPSAEGSRVTHAAQSFGFQTYAPLEVVLHGCDGGYSECIPLAPFHLRFNNPLDEGSLTQENLRVAPEIPGLQVYLYNDIILINGETRGQTSYTVTLSAGIQDIFGQTLGKETVLLFEVGKAEPNLVGPDQEFITLDPAAKKSVYAINYSRVDVRIYSVQPDDWPAFRQYMREWQRTDVHPAIPGELVYDQSMALDLPADTLSEVDLPLSPYLKDGFGQFIVIVEPPEGMFTGENEKWQRYAQTIQAWVQVTHIGLDAYTDPTDMIVWATDLSNGKPLEGVRIQPERGGDAFSTGKDGTARAPIPSGARFLVANLGADRAMLLHSPSIWNDDGWTAGRPSDSLRWFVFDDRQMYRPGEEVHIKGWLRRVGGQQDGDICLVGSDVDSVSYQLRDQQDNSIGSGQAEVNALGGFDFVFTIPKMVNLGQAYLNLDAQGRLAGLGGTSYGHVLQVQEFRRPEYEVNASTETSGPYFAGGHAVLAVEASYYAGGPLPEADVTWEVTSKPGTYSPPNWPDFIFGEWHPWWDFYRYDYPDPGGENQTETFSGKTDADGRHLLRIDFDQPLQPEKPQPISISAQATVMDVNRQAWASSTALLVHPADLYVGLRSERYFVEKGTPLKVDFIVTDLDGEPVAGRPVVITAARLEWKLQAGEWKEEEADPQECSQTSGKEPGSCSFETPIGGSYRITAIVTDDQGRKNMTRFTRWVSGGQQPPARNVEQEQVTLVPDKETYQPGDNAQILVQSPFSPAEGLLTVSRSGFLYSTRFQVENGSTTLSVPILAEHIPNLNIQVDLVGSAPRTDQAGESLKNAPPRPAFATAQLSLRVPPLQRTLAVQVKPDANQLEPGGTTTLRVSLKDAAGHPVAGAELTAVVVDEAILALTDYQMADPISIFYSERGAQVDSRYGRSSVVLANPQAMVEQAASMGVGGGLMMAATAAPMMAEAPAPGDRTPAAQPGAIAVRSDFNPLAAFAPALRTGPDGEASLLIKVPDNLTRYRVMVVAVDGSGRQFGTGESNITARLPLMVRPSAPRFLNFGDQFELPVVLQNQTNAALTVEVVARASNLELQNTGLRVSVPANDRIEVRFPASTIEAGTARLQVAAVSGTYADAAVVELPVYTPATTEAFATYGVVDAGAVAQPVLYPNGVFPQYGGLEISTSSTALQALTDAVLYLVNYPFECSEQAASRILAVAALRDVLSAFQADGLPAPADMEAAVKNDMSRLQGMQNEDGGFPYWRRGFESSPFNTIHAAHAFIRAQQKGFEVPVEMQQGALNYLREIEAHYPYWYGQRTRWTLSAYALYVRELSGDRDAQKAQNLLRQAGVDDLPMEAIGWLWPVIEDEAMRAQIRTFVGNHVVETAGAANFITSYDDQTYLLLSSNRRTDAILLNAIMQEDPKSDLITKLVNGLLAHRTRGRWENTQENVFVLLSLDSYFNTYEAQTPDFVARLWFGDTYAGSSAFQGRTTDIHETSIPMQVVLSATGEAGRTQNLLLSKEGPGRLYYRLGLRYAPLDLDMPALDMGFVVRRTYEGLDDPDDVSQDADGVWHIKAGAKVRVHLTMVTDTRRYHVALVDPLPAGLEIINPVLSVSQDVPQEDPATRRYGWWWWRTWYEHQNLRDDRAEAFTSLLWDGVYEYTYYARATTPGTFVVPPSKAEEMYSPEVFGRSASDVVVVR
jgi:uncharacterized protein YfaS (alpha-2-macroglobulin family)